MDFPSSDDLPAELPEDDAPVSDLPSGDNLPEPPDWLDDVPAESPDEQFAQPSVAGPPPPVLTIHIQSWSTLVFGLMMMLLGGLIGYALNPVASGALPAADAGDGAVPVASIPDPQQASKDALMEMVIGETRHFIGSPDAPVTMIEFSDFM